MALDRGGLNYSIKVRDEFSKNTIRFRDELAKSRRAFRQFRTERARNVRNAAQAEKAQLQVSQQQLRLEREKLRNREVQARLARQQAAEERRIARERATAERRTQQTLDRTNRARSQAVRQQRTLTRETRKTDKAAGGLAFKFRRLVGTLAVFTLAREAVAGFNRLVASAVRFNDTIEGATLGIGGLITAVGEVRDAQGELVEGAEGFAVATGIAREQVAALRQDSLRTVATFEELLDTFQVAVGPGLAAGLGLDEVRTLSVQISQAATALQVPQNQLAEEIRSLLSGTIQARTTRIATALGITNEDIRQLKEAGTLFEELTGRLGEFSLAAEEAAKSTVSGISTLLQGALSEALGQAAAPLTEGLLSSLRDVFDNVVTVRDELGNLRPNPQFVRAFQPIFAVLNDALGAIRQVGEALGFEGAATIGDLVGALGTGLVEAGRSVGLVFAGLVEVVQGALDAFDGLISALDSLAGEQGSLSFLEGLLAALRLVGFGFNVIASGLGQLIDALRLAVLQIRKFFSVGSTPEIDAETDRILGRIQDRDTDLREDGREFAKGIADLFNEDPIPPPPGAETGTSTPRPQPGTQQNEDRLIALRNEVQLNRDLLAIRGEGVALSRQVSQEQQTVRGITEQILRLEAQRASEAREFANRLQESQRQIDAAGDGPLGDQLRETRTLEIQRFSLLRQIGAQKLRELETSRELARIEARRADREREAAFRARSRANAARRRREQAERDRARQESGGSLGEGLQAGALQFGAQFASEFQAGIQLARQSLQSFAAFASQTIVDAFDPTQDLNLQERIARFLQQIAQTIIQQAIQIAIARRALEQQQAAIQSAAASGATAGFNAAPGIIGGLLGFPGFGGRAQGGLIPHNMPQARGYATGGLARPSHVAPSDTVPAWLTPGEFVMRKSAVDSIGVSTLAALNSGSVGVKGSGDAAGSPGAAGMASGGVVQSTTRGASAGAGGVVQPAIVANERTIRQLNSGGRRAQLEFIRKNSSTVNAALPQRRRRRR
jgi:hypothetical protein